MFINLQSVGAKIKNLKRRFFYKIYKDKFDIHIV